MTAFAYDMLKAVILLPTPFWPFACTSILETL
jgi:hypothetical protein